MKFIFLTILTIPALIGAIFIGILVHESYHVISSDETRSLCLDFGQNSLAHIESIDSTPDNFEEAKAFSIGTLACLLLTVIILVIVARIYKQREENP